MTHPHPRRFKNGEIIIKQGDEGHCAYLIEKGRVAILLEDDNGEIRHLGSRGAGAMIGEMSLIDHAPRTATVKALEDCELLEITNTDFSHRLENSDPILKMAMQVVLTRYRDMLRRSDIHHETAHTIEAEAQEILYAKNSEIQDCIKIANEFETALSNDQIALHYQPIIDLPSGQVKGFEALMRWKHPVRGFISPAFFIPILENNGLIVKASQWALKTSLSTLKRIEEHCTDGQSLFMSINFSSQDFSSSHFMDDVRMALKENDISPERIHLEITERLLIEHPENAGKILESCREAGLHISIDDFGTGYSSLSYLHYFPIDTLKIDQSFVKNITRNKRAMELVKGIVALGKNLNMTIIAEGIESKEEAAILRDFGCDQAQGYFFAKPLSEQETINFLKTAPNFSI